MLENNPRNISARGNCIGLYAATFNRIAREELRWYPCRVKVKQQLKENYFQRRSVFSHWFLQQCSNPCIISNIVIASYWGYLKSQVFVTPPNNTQCLQNRIQIELENLSQNPGVIGNAVRSMKKGTRICIEKYGRRVEKNLQKQPPIGVHQNSCSANMQQIYRRTSMWKYYFNKDAVQFY